MGSTAIVDIACGFSREGVLCETNKARDRAVVDTAKGLLDDGYDGDVCIIVTGNVAYRPGAQTLAELKLENVRNLLVIAGVSSLVDVVIAKEGYDSFSEARAVTTKLRTARGLDRTFVVSSDWYFGKGLLGRLFPYGRCVWQMMAQAQGLEVVFVEISLPPAGIHTRFTYLILGALVRAATLIGKVDAVERYLKSKTVHRKTEGFTWSGCD